MAHSQYRPLERHTQPQTATQAPRPEHTYERDAMSQVNWTTTPDLGHASDAQHYLHLITGPKKAAKLVTKMLTKPPTTFKAKDLLRAAGLDQLTADDPHVAGYLTDIANGKELPPVYAIKGSAKHGRPLQIADGYHRTCASFITDPSTDIPVQLAKM